jgi:uncharacterized protein with PIN domain
MVNVWIVSDIARIVKTERRMMATQKMETILLPDQTTEMKLELKILAIYKCPKCEHEFRHVPHMVASRITPRKQPIPEFMECTMCGQGWAQLQKE